MRKSGIGEIIDAARIPVLESIETTTHLMERLRKDGKSYVRIETFHKTACVKERNQCHMDARFGINPNTLRIWATVWDRRYYKDVLEQIYTQVTRVACIICMTSVDPSDLHHIDLDLQIFQHCWWEEIWLNFGTDGLKDQFLDTMDDDSWRMLGSLVSGSKGSERKDLESKGL